MRDSFRMTDGVFQGNRASLYNPDQGEAIDAELVNNRFQVSHARGE